MGRDGLGMRIGWAASKARAGRKGLILQTPGEVSRWSRSAEACAGASLGLVNGLSDSGTVDVDQTVVEERGYQ